MEIDAERLPEDSAETLRRTAVEAITDAADRLLTRGQTEVYDTEREMLIRQFSRDTGEEWVDYPKEKDGPDGSKPSGEPKLWEFRWLDGRDGGQINGPYDSTTMTSWDRAGYFGEGVESRRTDAGGEWSRTVDFL